VVAEKYVTLPTTFMSCGANGTGAACRPANAIRGSSDWNARAD